MAPRNVYTGRINYDWTISPTLLNSFRVGFNRQLQYLASAEASEDWGTKLGISGLTLDFLSSIADNSRLWRRTKPLSDPISNTFLYSDSVSWTKGKHNFKFGEDLRRLQHQNILPSSPASFNFSTLETGLPGASGTTGNEFASFLLGQVDSASTRINNVVEGNRFWYSGAVRSGRLENHPQDHHQRGPAVGHFHSLQGSCEPLFDHGSQQAQSGRRRYTWRVCICRWELQGPLPIPEPNT